MSEFPYRAPKHLEHLTKFADFGEHEVIIEAQGKCPNCDSTRLRYADDYDELKSDNEVLCEECNEWCYEYELELADPDTDDNEENNDVEYEDDQEDRDREARLAAERFLAAELEDDEFDQYFLDSGIEPSEEEEVPEQGPNVLLWHDAQAAEKSLVGGKGANLAVLQQAGLPVPVGFNIPSYVFESAVPDPGYLKQLLASGEYETAVQYVKTEVPVPADEILAAFDSLGVERVAVRSSAVAEDGSEQSYAGRQDTFLYQSRDGGAQDPRSPDPDFGVVEAVRQCWASWVAPRAVQYREKIGPEAVTDLRMAVVVQTMLEPQAGGVGFSEDQTGGGGLMLIRANTIDVEAADAPWKVVAGETADVYRIDKTSGQVANMEIYNGGVLRPEHTVQLHDYALMLEDRFEGPQDFEWAIENDQVYLLQSRPITT